MNRLIIQAFSTAAAAAISFSAVAQAQPSEMAANDFYMKQIGADVAWSRGYTGKGIRIGIVDTGADLANKDLKNIILAKSPYYTTMRDVTNGHGTQMISIAAGTKNGTGMVGVAYDANVIAYAGGYGGMLVTNDVINGVKWNADNKADVINLSLGMTLVNTSFSSYYTDAGNGNYVRKSGADGYSSTAMLPALQYATSKGSVIVMAAGNDGNPVPTSPANLAVKTDVYGNLVLGGRAVIVGAVDKNNVIASFSNRAGNICQTMVKGVCQDKVQIKDYFLVAPGGNLVWTASANSTTGAMSQGMGTSEATAFVSGGVAVIKQAWPTLKPEQIVQILLKTATDLGAVGVDSVYGNGLMNLNAATKPIGSLTLAKMTNVTASQIASGPVTLSSTGLSGGILNKQSFSSSTVMQNAQAVDSMGRNFSVNMTAGMNNTLGYYSPATAYSSLSEQPLNYVDFGYNGPIGAMYNSSNMSGARFGHQFSEVYVGLEFGAAKERNALLGSHGAGALALGDSTTTWNAVHLSKQVSENNTLFGSIAQGRTNTTSANDSMLNGFSQLVTQSWSLGMSHSGVIDNKDSVSFQVTELPRITKGTVNVSGVTGFKMSDVTDNGANATPINSVEKVSLVSDYRQYASTVGYTRSFSSTSKLSVNLTVQSDNAGSDFKKSSRVSFVQYF
jgi:Subtilase family